jgi:hypothetical protein
MSKNLLIGFGVNLYSNIESMRNFCISLRKYYDGDAVLITDTDNQEFIDFIKGFDIKVLKTSKRITVEDLMIQRWAIPIKVIESFPEADNVILSDTRDLIYQGNPFDFLVGDELELTTEVKKVGECPDWNSRWIATMYGNEILETVKDQQIICGGYMCGKRNGIIKLCELMVEESKNYPKTIPGHPPIFVDQAAMNVFYKQGKFPSTTLHPTGGPFVATIGSSLGPTRLDEEGFLTTGDGVRPAVVHQYDRHPKLVEAFNKRLRAA